MANNGIRGITLEISGDVTPLTSALRDVDKATAITAQELRQIEQGLRFNPSSTELLAQRQEVLAQQINNTTTRLNTLREAQEQVNQQFERGDISAEQYRSFNREIERTEGILRNLQQRAAQGVEVEGDTRGIDRLRNAIAEIPNTARQASSAASTAITGIGAAATAAGAAIVGITAGFQETNTDIAILNTQLGQVGLSLDQVSAATTNFSVVGQGTDQIAEAFGNLVAAGYTTAEQIDVISQNIAGAIVKYGDTFNAEGIGESIALTTELNEASGQLLDLLEREGINIDDFNAKIATFGTEAEKAQFITDTLANQGLADLNAAFQTGNPALVEQAEAQQRLTQNLSELSVTLTPILTLFTDFANVILEVVNGNITLEEAFDSLSSKAEEVFPKVLETGVNALTNLYETAASISPQLAGFIANALEEMLGLLSKALPQFIDSGFQLVSSLIKGLGNNLPNLLKEAVNLIAEVVRTIIANLPRVLETGVSLIESILEGIAEALPSLLSQAVQLIVQLAATIIENLPTIIAAGGRIITALVKGIVDLSKNLATTVTKDLIPQITKTFQNFKWSNIGKDIIDGLVNGLANAAKAVYNKAREIASNIEETIRSALQTRSPSKVTTRIGEDVADGLIVGLQNRGLAVTEEARRIANDVIEAFSNTRTVNIDDLISLGADDSTKRLAELNNQIADFNKTIGFSDVEVRSFDARRQQIIEAYNEITQKADEYRQQIQANSDGPLRDFEVADLERRIGFLFGDDLAKYQAQLQEVNDEEKAYLEQFQDIQEAKFEAQKEFVDLSINLNNLSLKDQAELYNEFAQQYSQDSEQFQYFADQKLAAQRKLTDAVTKINNEFTAKIKKANDDLIANTQKVEQRYTDAFNGIRDSVLSATSGFGAFQRGEIIQGQTLIDNLQSQIRGINEFNSVVNSLSGRVDDTGFQEFIRSLGPESLAELEAINSLSREELDQYVELYNERFQRANDVATISLQGLRQDVDAEIVALQSETATQLQAYELEWSNAISNITGNVESQFSDLPKTLEQTGRDIIQSISDGLSNTLPSLNAQLQQIANSISSTINSALDLNLDFASIQASTQRLASAAATTTGSLANSANRSTQAQQVNQNIINQQSQDNQALVDAVLKLAESPIMTNVSLDGRTIAQAVSGYQYQTVATNAITRGVIL